MALNVLYRDNHLFAVAKPAGVPTVPDESGDESLFDQAKAWIKREYQKPGAAFLAIVHRLDRPVSGVVLFGRTSKAAARLTRAFRERSVTKTYVGVCHGSPQPPAGDVTAWLVKDRERRLVRAHAHEVPGAKLAQTRYRTLGSRDWKGERCALVELIPETGRSHQLRVAAQGLGAPLLGDLKYGAPRPLEDRSIALHARRLELEHPTTGAPVVLECAPPDRPWWGATP